MEYASRQTRASRIAEVWQEQYKGFKGFCLPVIDKLLALSKDPHPDDIDKIIGSSLWTRCACNECKQSGDAVVRVGDEPDYDFAYDSATTWLCRSCIEKALAMFVEREKQE